MKEVLISIDKAGRVVIPKDVREELAINPGDFLKISVSGDEVKLRPDRVVAGFVKRGGALVFSTGNPDLLRSESVEAIRREEQESLGANVKKGLPQLKRK